MQARPRAHAAGRARHQGSATAPPRHHRMRPATGRAGPRTSWELRSFTVAAAAIAGVFVLALLYLSQITSLSAGDYEVQRLQVERDELRRQNALLEVQVARLDAPARIEALATRLGLVHAGNVPLLFPEPLQAKK